MPDKKCPLFKKPCLTHGCEWYEPLRGRHPQTGQEIDEYGCNIKWLTILLIENAQMTRAVTDTLDAFRKETIAGNERLIEAENIRHLPHSMKG